MLAVASGAGAIGGGFVVVQHFATTSWPLSGGEPGVLAAAGVLLVLAQTLKAIGWARLFAPAERPHLLALAAGNGGAALIGTVLPGRFDDAMRVAAGCGVQRASHVCESGYAVVTQDEFGLRFSAVPARS